MQYPDTSHPSHPEVTGVRGVHVEAVFRGSNNEEGCDFNPEINNLNTY